MNYLISWQYDEFQQVGKDYTSEAEVNVYDSSHADFRDMEAEGNQVLDQLGIKITDTLIDFGSGTGSFAIQAARRCAKVYAVDVSPTMISLAEAKATQANLLNIEFHHSGFLTYQHQGQAVDVITTTFALHHLPDFWKAIALDRINSMLKTGGELYICDVIIDSRDAINNINVFINNQEIAGGKFLLEDAQMHFRDEYSTYDWVMDGLLSRSGFTIKSKSIEGGVMGKYLCVKN